MKITNVFDLEFGCKSVNEFWNNSSKTSIDDQVIYIHKEVHCNAIEIIQKP